TERTKWTKGQEEERKRKLITLTAKNDFYEQGWFGYTDTQKASYVRTRRGECGLTYWGEFCGGRVCHHLCEHFFLSLSHEKTPPKLWSIPKGRRRERKGNI
ncbi:haloacid dehalogenase-like hydrolase domain-containing protein 3, partial [Striga asiatica]